MLLGTLAAPAPSLLDIRLAGKPKLHYRGATAAAVPLAAEGVSSIKAGLLSASVDAPPPPPPLSCSDADFAARGLEFVWGGGEVDMEELNDLFVRVNFPRRDPGKLAIALSNTYRTVWIRAAKKSRMAKQGQLLGFARATSDGALSATIWDVAVNPAWQRIGLGRALVERLTASLLADGIACVTLYAEPNVVSMYEKLGFQRAPEGVRGLAFQRQGAVGRQLLAGLGISLGKPWM